MLALQIGAFPSHKRVQRVRHDIRFLDAIDDRFDIWAIFVAVDPSAIIGDRNHPIAIDIEGSNAKLFQAKGEGIDINRGLLKRLA